MGLNQTRTLSHTTSQSAPNTISKGIHIQSTIGCNDNIFLQSGQNKHTQLSSPYVQNRQDQEYHYPMTLLVSSHCSVSMIVDETNHYTEQALQGTDKVWSTNAEEIQVYIGFMILMGISHLPEIRNYWSVSILGMPQLQIELPGIDSKKSHATCILSIMTHYQREKATHGMKKWIQ